MSAIPGLTVVKKPFETYFVVREDDGDRELTAAECEQLERLANAAPMIFLGTPDMKALAARLQGYADDPMWDAHAEVPKSLLLEAINALTILSKQQNPE